MTIRKEYCRGKIEPVPRILDNLQDQLVTSLAALESDELSRRKIYTAALASGSNTIYHDLQRLPKGWLIVDRDSAATVYRTDWDAETLTLQASGVVNIRLYIF